MFCSYCGKKIEDHSNFCPFCGNSVSGKDIKNGNEENPKADDAVRNTAETIGNTVEGTAKSKHKYILIILGVLALAIVAIGVYLGTHADNDSSDMMEQSKTFTSEPEDVGVISAMTKEVTYKGIPVSVLLTSTAEEIIDVLGIPSELYENNLYYDDIGITVDEEGTFITGDASVFSVEGSSLNKNRDELAGIFGEPSEEGYDEEAQGCYMIDFHYMDYTISFQLAQPDDEAMRAWISSWQTATDSSKDAVDRNVAYKEAYAGKVRELAAEDDTAHFALIDLTGSDVPELAVDYYGYGVSVFTWADGEVIPLMDYWPYGAGGNMGYEYIPGQNVIRNINMDQAGAIVYELYMTVNNDCEIVSLLEEDISVWHFRDVNGNGSIDEGEYCEEPVYYYGDTEISKEEYASYQVPGDFEQITGDLSAEMILEELEGNDTTSRYSSDDIISEYYEPIENYLRLGGYYVGNTGQSTLSFSVYTSQEEGEREIGVVDIYTDNGQHYSGFVIPVEEGVYKVMADTGEEILLVESAFDDVAALQLYVDGQFLEEYRMTEHYES